MCPCFVRAEKSGRFSRGIGPRVCEPRAKHRRSRASDQRGAQDGRSVTFALANWTPTLPQVFVLTDFQHGQSALARSSPRGHPMLLKPARYLAQGHHPLRGEASLRECRGGLPRHSGACPRVGICAAFDHPGLQSARPGLDARVQARLDARWSRRLRVARALVARPRRARAATAQPLQRQPHRCRAHAANYVESKA